MSLEAAWAAKRNRNTCGKGHPIEPFKPGGKFRRCMVCERTAREALRSNPDIPQTAVRRAVELLRAGEPISRLAGFGPDGKYVKGAFVVRPERFKAFCAAHPQFGRPILKLIKQNSIVALREVRRKGSAANAARFAPRILLRADDHVPRIHRAVASLPSEIRDDVFQSIALAVLDRRVRPEQIEQCVNDIKKAHYRMFSKYVPVIGGVMRSTDQRLFEDGVGTLGDSITTGLWD